MARVRPVLQALSVLSLLAWAAFFFASAFGASRGVVLALAAVGLPGAFAELVVVNRGRWRRRRARRAERAS